ncbi:MerR family transcriptional regulator [Actinokineospora iranica]|uniref:DNA-binding transcriptional regulator, MerR family n=1 Tax=Actinokineospora iranica TaxID=1271860 RepID=A0A1G6QLT5_9PSEU|nr:MerR family transcriptional regulator [Actinokineospora iranica]SDC93329.1 DNA-binding transcriptional regulator, MerR family [Actinokineospora iranica]
MAWSIAQVARMSKVTSRTLRHYDDIGLLPPARVGDNGYRYYEQEQLLRLQQILVLRELGLGLDAIAEIVNQGRDRIEALRMHHRWLLAERDRLDRLARTVSRTISEVQGGEKVTSKSAAHWFEGFDSAKQEQLQQEARDRWGAEHVDAANKKFAGTPQDWWQTEGQTWLKSLNTLIAHIDAGRLPTDPAVQETIDGHYQWIQGTWVPNRESYTGLANLYADDPRFRANFDKTDPRLAEYLRAAMTEYARTRLS